MTLYPTVTGSSVVACKFKGGVVIACDTLASYGTLAMFKDMRRVVKANQTTLMSFDGEVSDFQLVQRFLREIEQEDGFHDDGIVQGPKDTLTHFSRIMYQRRSKIKPLWNNLVVGGWEPSEERPFLGTTDMIGTMYEDNVIATGLGMHLALPILRAAWREDMTQEEAKELVLSTMKVLYYRDTRSINRVVVATVSQAGMEIAEPLVMDTQWRYEAFVKPV